MAEFNYNNEKNSSSSHTSVKLNCDYHCHISCKKDVDPDLKSMSANILITKLRNLMTVYRKGFKYAKKL